MRKVAIRSLLFFALLFLQGCVLFHSAKIVPPKLFTLDLTQINVKHSKKTHFTLMVLPTQATSVLATDQMPYVLKLHQWNYFAENRWATQPAMMITPLLTKALQNSGHFKAVVMSPFVGTADFYLNTQLLDLQQEFIQIPSKIRVTMIATLSDVASGKIIRSARFSTVVSAPVDNPYGGAIAANEAITQIINRIVKFCVG